MEVVVIRGEVDGRSVVLELERRWRNSINLLRSVMMPRLIVLGHSLLRCLWVGRANEAFLRKSLW